MSFLQSILIMLVVIPAFVIFCIKYRLGLGHLFAMFVLMAAVALMRRYDTLWGFYIYWVKFRFSLWVLIFVTFLGWMIMIFQGPRTSPRMKAIVGLLSVFTVISLGLGLIFSTSIERTVLVLQAMATILLPIPCAYVLSRCIIRRYEDFDRFAVLFMISCGILLSAIGIAFAVAPGTIGQFVGWTRGFGTTERAFAPLGSAPTISFIVVLAHAVALCQLIRGKNRVLAGITLVGTFVCLVLTLTRSGMLAWAIVIFLMVMPLARRAGKFIVALLLIGMLLLPLSYYMLQEYDLSRLIRTADSSMRLRAESAKTALYLFVGNPAGSGPANTYTMGRATGEFLPHEVEVKGHISAREPHNLYLFLLVEHGILAGACYLGVLFILFKRTCGGLKIYDTDTAQILRLFRAVWISLAFFVLTDSDLILITRFAVIVWTVAFVGLMTRHAIDSEALYTEEMEVIPGEEHDRYVLQPE